MPKPHRIVIAADHGGWNLKNDLVARLRNAGYTVEDLGTDGPESVDYPDFAREVTARVTKEPPTRGILVCGTGVGMAIAANRNRGIRAVNCTDTYTARLSREHNDSNLLTLGERVVGPGLAWDIVQVWLETPFSGDERHGRRIAKIEPTT